MLMQQCMFRNGNTHTQGWVDAKKIKKATRVKLEGLKEGWWDITYKGPIKDHDDINRGFKNNFTEKFGNKS